MEIDRITQSIIGASIEVHWAMGPGLLESVYEECLAQEFQLQQIPFSRQQTFPLQYKGRALNADYRIDFLVAGLVIVELKAVDQLLPIHDAQLLTCLKLTDKNVGLLLNFKSPVMKNGIKRIVTNYHQPQ
jgi:GxxExxY protein